MKNNAINEGQLMKNNAINEGQAILVSGLHGNNAINEGQAHEAPNMDFMLPFRCYCTRKRKSMTVL
ncbi:U-box domain-containing protein 35 [Prunus yedoensis var. nudiflora]|uniref:U-box domain-containing protein 35 n=1 Tax=Prunus yedoensis var. nudiflora TaxID=2094558 RepID=A0A314Y5Z0_PRUYE|nr:U-box domain-containing protein 35 [Prunus yedoensis var. nudiflora]